MERRIAADSSVVDNNIEPSAKGDRHSNCRFQISVFCNVAGNELRNPTGCPDRLNRILAAFSWGAGNVTHNDHGPLCREAKCDSFADAGRCASDYSRAIL